MVTQDGEVDLEVAGDDTVPRGRLLFPRTEGWPHMDCSHHLEVEARSQAEYEDQDGNNML